MPPDMLYGGTLGAQRRITFREQRTVLVFALVVMALTTLPYLVGVAAQRDGWQFGGFLFGVEDGNSYLAKMREGAQQGIGGWLFHIVYTSEPHDGAFLFTPYLAAGKLAALGLSDPLHDPAFVTVMLIVFHTARIVFGALAIWVSYAFMARFVPRGLRWLAITLSSLGGGLGWLLIVFGPGNLLGSAPIDFYLPEGYTFFLLYGLPHLALARAALLGGFLFLFSSAEGRGLKSLRNSLAAGLCWLVMGLCVPFYIAVVYALLGAWGIAALLRHRRFPTALFIRCLIAALPSAPLLLYNLVVFAINPVMVVFAQQNKLPTPNPIHFVFGFGVLALLALPAIGWAWRRGRTHTAYLLLPAWVIAAPLLAYLPVSVQRRLLEGVFVPLCTLAVVGLRLWVVPQLRKVFRQRSRRVTTRQIWQRTAVVLLTLALPSTLLIWLTSAVGVTRTAEPLFHPAAEQTALDWLNARAPAGAVVLSSKATGNYIPARTNLRVFVGHGPETLNSDAKRDLAIQFFDGTQPLSALQRPGQDPIRYIFYGPQEAAGHDPGALAKWSAPLKRIYAQNGYTIFEVP